jgi:WASH complex subunit 7
VLNTIVNFSFQFLKSRLVTFSQFLYDEHIKSRLAKDAAFFTLHHQYPFTRFSAFFLLSHALLMPRADFLQICT